MGQYSFDGQFDGSNRFEYGQNNNNGDVFYGMGDYDYSAGWGNSDYFGETGMTMVIDSNGKIGVNKPLNAVHDTADTDADKRYVQTDTGLIHSTSTNINSGGAGLSEPLHDVANVGTHPHYDMDNLTRYWSFMHRLWGQASANQREFIDPIGRETNDETGITDQRKYGEDKPTQQGTTNPTSTGVNDRIGESYDLNSLTSTDSQEPDAYYPSRWYGYHENNRDVTNNLAKGSRSEYLDGRFLGATDGLNDRIEMLRGRHGKTLYDFYGGYHSANTANKGVPVANEPWDILNSHNRHEFEATGTSGRQRALTSPSDSTWGFTTGNIQVEQKSPTVIAASTLPPFGEMGRNTDEQIFVDSGFFDASWELGKPLLGSHTDPRGDNHFQQDQRWFEGINAGSASLVSVGSDSTNEPDDKAKMRCWTCEIQYGLHWNPDEKHFYTRDKRNTANTPRLTVDGDQYGYGAWGDCEREGESKTCEYSSGVCFVEERRTFGYITLVRKGCKQAQACYMQKYQNFLVQAGRQCWPGDGQGNSMKVAARPNDVMADQWIYNLVSGGNRFEYTTDGQWNDFMDIESPQTSTERSTNNIASTFDFKYNTWNEFDKTFVDVDRDGQVDRTTFTSIHGPTFGFYKVNKFFIHTIYYYLFSF